MTKIETLIEQAKNGSVVITATVKFKGHGQLHVCVSHHHVYDCRVWNYAKNKIIESFDLRSDDAQEKLDRYFKKEDTA